MARLARPAIPLASANGSTVVEMELARGEMQKKATMPAQKRGGGGGLGSAQTLTYANA